MRKNTFVARNHIQAINIFREALKGDSFTMDELKQTLREGGIPSNTVFINTLRKTPVLTQVGKDQFKFSNPKQPVYYGLLDRVYKDYRIKTRMYQETYREKKRGLNSAKSTKRQQALAEAEYAA